MTVEMVLGGFEEMEDALENLAESVRKPVIRRALKKAALPMAALANSLAPVGLTGDYARSFVYSTKLSKRQAGIHRKMFRDDRAAVEGFVGTSDPAGVQQEFGNVNHSAQPAMRPAWDQDHKALLERLKSEIWVEIKKSMARAERKAARLAAGG